jgi:hypothetical protein
MELLRRTLPNVQTCRFWPFVVLLQRGFVPPGAASGIYAKTQLGANCRRNFLQLPPLPDCRLVSDGPDR